MLTPREKLLLDLFPAGIHQEAEYIAEKAKGEIRTTVNNQINDYEGEHNSYLFDERSEIEKSIIEEITLLVKEKI